LKAVVKLDVPEWQLWQPVTVYFRDTMKKTGVCKPEQAAVEPRKENDGNPQPWEAWWYVCGDCGKEIDYHDRFCRWCGRGVKWE
jgi:hypothetical protein